VASLIAFSQYTVESRQALSPFFGQYDSNMVSWSNAYCNGPNSLFREVKNYFLLLCFYAS
jgi:hypothetical protein